MIQTEHANQVSLFYWAHVMSQKYNALNNMFAIPNAGKRSLRAGANMRLEGLRKGVPDIFLAYPSKGSQWPNKTAYNGLFIEMKSKKGILRKEQTFWLGQLTMAGYKAVVCRSWHEAAKVICEYLNIECEGL